MARSEQKPQPERLPWGRAAGLLVACASTIAGAVQGAGPTYLLYRACVAGIVACIIVNLFARLVSGSSPAASKP